MRYSLVYSALAEREISEALAWYSQENIHMGEQFLAQLERTAGFIMRNPELYPRSIGGTRRANLNQFPYALFYLIENEQITVISCFHQRREPLQ